MVLSLKEWKEPVAYKLRIQNSKGKRQELLSNVASANEVPQNAGSAEVSATQRAGEKEMTFFLTAPSCGQDSNLAQSFSPLWFE